MLQAQYIDSPQTLDRKGFTVGRFTEKVIAVGTAVSGGPPHRSVREELPHTAPALSRTRNRATSRTPCNPRDSRLIRRSVRCETACSAFLLAESLSSTDSAGASAAPLFVGVAGTTDSSDFLLAFMSALPSETFSDRSTGQRYVAQWKPTGSPGSRAWDVCACTGSSTPPRPSGPGQLAASTMLPSPCQHKIGTRKV